MAAIWAAQQIAAVARALEARNSGGKWKIDVVAHSQGSMVFARALEYLPFDIRSRINYIGVEPEQDVAGNGLVKPQNIHDHGDAIPLVNYAPWRIFNLPFYLLGGTISPTDTVQNTPLARIGLLVSHTYINHYSDIQAAAVKQGK